ncbi:hypothetical protein Tco_1100108 [Tanacetum coccineum]
MDKGTQNYSLDHMFEGTNLSVLVDKTKSARDGLKTAHTEIGLDSPKDDEPIIVQDDSDEEVHAEKVQPEEPKEIEDASASHPPSLKSIQIQELTNQVLLLQSQNSKLKKEKTKAEAEVALLSAQPSYPNVAQLTELLWELPAEFLSVPTQVAFVQVKIKTLVALLSLLNKVTKALNKFAQNSCKNAKKTNLNKPIPTTSIIPPIITTTTTQLEYPFLPSLPKSSSQPEGELIKKDKGKEAMSSKDAKEEKTKSDSNDTINLTGSMGDHVHFTKEQIKEQKRIKESVKADLAKQELEIIKEEWIDLLSVNVMTKYYKAKLQYDKYCDKMLNRRAQLRITNCHVLTRKGPITLKACPNRKGAGWATIYEQIQTRIDYLQKTKAKLGIDLDKPLGEQDPIDKLNDLAKKKRKHADDIHDLFRSTKKFKSYVQHGDQLAGTVLNEPILGMFLFNSIHRHDFVTIEDFEDFPNKMLYTVQEIIFRLHQVLGLDDHARIFSSLLLVEVDKKNLNQANEGY